MRRQFSHAQREYEEKCKVGRESIEVSSQGELPEKGNHISVESNACVGIVLPGKEEGSHQGGGGHPLNGAGG